MCRGRAREPDREHAFFAARDAVHALLERGHVGQDAACVGEEQAARVGQRHAFRMALEQREAELGLECADLLRQRGLLDAELGGGAGHVARVGDGLEVAQVPKLHIQNISRSGSQYI